MSDVGYRPQLAYLIESAERDWSNYNKEDIVYYGINVIDDALFGIDMQRGEMIGIQAPEKNRKTTLVFNILFSIAAQYTLRSIKDWIVFDTLESGMPPEACRDQMIAMKSTREIIAKEFGTREKWPDVYEIRKRLLSQLTISKEFLRFGSPDFFQQSAITRAKEELSSFPISIFGPSYEEGNTRDIQQTIERWHLLYNGEYPAAKGQEYRVFISDNIQLYYGFGSDKFDQMEEVVAQQAHFLVTHPGSVVISVSQMGKGSLSDRKKGGEAYAKGGGALAAEATVLFETEYDKDRNPDSMLIKVPRTRKKPPPIVVQELDRESGAFLRPAQVLGRGK